jgi:hypothetical protein
MSEEAGQYRTGNPLRDFLEENETFVANGRAYQVRREDISALAQLMQEYLRAFEELAKTTR